MRSAMPGAASMPEIRVIAPGRTYRVDSDATHSPMFHQFEGLWIGENVSFKRPEGRVSSISSAPSSRPTTLKLRFRPCVLPVHRALAPRSTSCSRAGRSQGRWLEVAGSGQVHPHVVRNFGLDPERYIGFAFGSGIDRLAMLRYGIERPAPVLRRRPALPGAVRSSARGDDAISGILVARVLRPADRQRRAGRAADHGRAWRSRSCARSRRRSRRSWSAQVLAGRRAIRTPTG